MHPLNKKVKFMKDSIDFGSMEIPKLFRKLLIPTVLGKGDKTKCDKLSYSA